ncbi:hydrogenase maturation nickel metallochaperone HypA [Candidatus Omnitrophota bacterium]
MHEFSLVKKEVDRLKDKVNGKKVNKVVFSLGRLSHGTPQSISQAFKTIAVNSPLSSAELQVVDIEPKIKCQSCGEIYGAEGGMKLTCVQCGSGSSEVIAGQECYISSIEIED